MWDTLTWRELRNPEIAAAIAGLREDMLNLFLAIITLGYLAWQLAVTFLVPTAVAPHYWSVFPFLVPGLVAAYLLQRREPRLATVCLLFAAVLSVTAAVWYLGSALGLIFYPLAALIAVVLLSPLAGLLVSLASIAAVVLMWQSGQVGFLDEARVIEVALATLLTVLAAAALGRSMVVAVEWSLQSYEQALRNTRDAQDHRARLVQALKQLDNAYYRLQQANAALDMAWKAAEAAEHSKTEFVTNISHEIRTPLNLIVGFSEMILSSPESYGVHLPAAYRVDLNAINRSAQHLLTLTNDIIDLARVGVGRLALAREPVALTQVVEDACGIIREYVTIKGLWLRVEVQPDLPVLNVDRLRVRQVLLNLLTNAARFTERGGITVSAAREGDWVVVKVTDTGHGIPTDRLPHVFEEFGHGGEDNLRLPARFGGFGLGLPISRRFVELHGGQMGVESVVGAGTTFWFTLPTATVDGTPQGETWRPLRLPSLATAGERVLVLAGGDAWLARFFQRHLRGFRVTAAADLRRAVAAAAELHAVGILADPTVAVDEASLNSPVPILRLPLPRGEEMAARLGVQTYLVKPVTRAELRAAIARVNRPIRTILVVDDDPSFHHLMTRILEASTGDASGPQYEILTARNGHAALALMAASPPDLVLLDVVMPEMGGQEVLAAMRAAPHLADVPVIVVSAQDEIEEQFPLRGPVSLLTPHGLRLEELLGVVEALFGVLRTPPTIGGDGQAGRDAARGAREGHRSG